MTGEQKVVAALESLLRSTGGRVMPMTASTHLRDELGLDSASLIELTVVVHTLYGIDLGRRAAELGVLPVTVGDVARLLESP